MSSLRGPYLQFIARDYIVDKPFEIIVQLEATKCLTEKMVSSFLKQGSSGSGTISGQSQKNVRTAKL